MDTVARMQNKRQARTRCGMDKKDPLAALWVQVVAGMQHWPGCRDTILDDNWDVISNEQEDLPAGADERGSLKAGWVHERPHRSLSEYQWPLGHEMVATRCWAARKQLKLRSLKLVAGEGSVEGYKYSALCVM